MLQKNVQVPVDGATLEVVDRGAGEPVLVIQTGVVADEVLALASEPVLANRYRVIGHHRRGYAGSTPTEGPGSIDRDVSDCMAVLIALGVGRAHVVGDSYSCAVALQLALDAPDLVHPTAPDRIRAAAGGRGVTPAVQSYRAGDRATAIDQLMILVGGPQWRTHLDRRVPGGAHQVEKNATTFFETDLPAILAWRLRDRCRSGRAFGLACPAMCRDD